MEMVLLTALGVGGATIFGSVIGFLFKGLSHRFSDIVLSFAAGAMLYVVVEELIPEANLCERGHAGTLGVMAGFLVMMILDVALG